MSSGVGGTERIEPVFGRLRDLSLGPPTDLRQRLALLDALRVAVRDRQAEIREAVWADFRKSHVEAELTEIATVLLELRTAIKGLPRWMEPRAVPARFPFWGTRSSVKPQSKGVVLIMSPWNYPVLLSLAPVISAIAAGNRVILKPSERTPNTSALLRDLIQDTLGPAWCVVIEGDATVGMHLLSLPFDHFFFTGSPATGRIVMKAAAEHHSSVTLELGGKSPAIVDESADIALAAEKIVIGKYLNAGQTCIAPDYVLAHEIIYDDLVDALTAKAEAIPQTNETPMTGIVDDAHARQLREFWEDARSYGAVIANGGAAGPEGGAAEPDGGVAGPDGGGLDLGRISVVTGVPLRSRMMREEIFGPILPVLRFKAVEDILGVVRGTGEPLTAYLFTGDNRFAEEIGARLKTGSICRDETLLHFAHPALPFGGVGTSGLGRTHGRHGFLAFSNEVSTLRQRWKPGVLSLLFPVKGSLQNRVRRWLIRYLG